MKIIQSQSSNGVAQTGAMEFSFNKVVGSGVFLRISPNLFKQIEHLRMSAFEILSKHNLLLLHH